VVVFILETTTQHGAMKDKTQTNKTKFYNLDATMAVVNCFDGQKKGERKETIDRTD